MSSRFATRRSALIPLAAALALIAGCTGVPNQGAGSTKATTDLTTVQVSGADGAKPEVKVQTPFSVTKTDRRTLKTGTGAIVSPGLRVTIDYVGVNGTDGKEFDTSFGKSDAATFTLDDKSIIKGLVSGLSGVTVGSRVLLAIPPVDGYKTAGAPQVGIGPTDTLVFLIDVKSAGKVLKRATGKTVKPKSGLPKVTLDAKSGQPTITIPKDKAPTKLVIQTLIQGNGAKIVKGQTVTAHYTGVIWPGGKLFDSTWVNGAPQNFQLGKGLVIAGWDQGLVGQRVGSQVLLVIPPDKGYGVAGKPEASIKGTDTLVFVVDLLETTG